MAESGASLQSIVRRLAAIALGAARTRLALAGLEFEEEIGRLVGVLIRALAMILFATLALLVFTIVAALATPPEDRVPALLGLATLYAVISALFYWRLRAAMANRPPIFAATLAELERDRAALSASAAAPLDKP